MKLAVSRARQSNQYDSGFWLDIVS
ncbi:hypothetical protein [Sodalis sp.]